MLKNKSLTILLLSISLTLSLRAHAASEPILQPNDRNEPFLTDLYTSDMSYGMEMVQEVANSKCNRFHNSNLGAIRQGEFKFEPFRRVPNRRVVGYFICNGFPTVVVPAVKETVDQDGVLRDDRGNILLMSQSDAIDACVRHGMYLPDIRALLTLNQSAGIRIKEQRDNDYSFWPVSTLDDRFYYSNANYTRPTSDLAYNGFWSSSIYAGSFGDHIPSQTDGFVFFAINGETRFNFHLDHKFAVRCIARR